MRYVAVISAFLARFHPARRPAIGSGNVLAAGALLSPPLAVLASKALAPLLAVLAVLILCADRGKFVIAVRRAPGLTSLLAALTVWCFVSTAWSILPEHSLSLSLRFAAMAGAGLLLIGAAASLGRGEQDRVRRAIVSGLVLGVPLMLTERLSGGAITSFFSTAPSTGEWNLAHFDHGTVVLAIALWPALSACRGRFLRFALACAVGLIVLLMVSEAAKLALLGGLLCFALGWYAPRATAIVLATGMAALALALPIATPPLSEVIAIHEHAPWLKISGIHRLAIWRFTADRISERPILGWGLDASRGLPGGNFDLAEAMPGIGLSPNSEALPLHPHNALLQWQVELGIPGTLLALTIIAWVLRSVASDNTLSRVQRAAAFGAATTILVIGLLSYGAWQEWWLSFLWLTAALFSATARGLPLGDEA